MANSNPNDLLTVTSLRTAYYNPNSRIGLDASPSTPHTAAASTRSSLITSPMSTPSADRRSPNPFAQTPAAATDPKSTIFTPQIPHSAQPGQADEHQSSGPELGSLADQSRKMNSKETQEDQENDIITIQVGENRFTTKRRTLTGKSLFFQNMFRDNWIELLPDGTPFIDRDGGLFKDILAYLRSKSYPLFWSERNGYDIVRYEKLYEEARYFIVDGLEEWLEMKSWEQVLKMRLTTVNVTKEMMEHAGGFEMSKGESTGQVMIVPRLARKGVFVCPEGKLDHEGRPALCASSCGLLSRNPKAVPAAPVIKGQPLPVRGGAGKGGLISGILPSRPVAGKNAAKCPSAADAANSYLYKKKEVEFLGVTLVQKEVEVDHGLLVGEKRTLGEADVFGLGSAPSVATQQGDQNAR